ncbi:alpha/beta fold hydrolase [Corynebacterium lubricantis]|uniref:alpha/beta fold hydrolase n=1 Tax=Corynebacterium lubricantis TaxID=541095 RepID=UPI000375C752|nr:alpha/beta fold hydrolase [Corynebacterium lubricantis]
METISFEQYGLSVHEHTLEVPWDRANPALGTLEVFARELVADESLPYLLYLQGGPGNPVPRPVEITGWMAEALKHYRIVLLDQRGTGRSTRIDKASLIDDRLYPLLRADSIVADAEDLRAALEIEQWDVLGQSFGGFCITHYLSVAPESARYAYFTGGLPSINRHADEVYRATFKKLEARQQEFFEEIPFAESRIREICHHLDNADERLSSGERLSSRRFRTVGVGLGRGVGFGDLAALLEAPFHKVGGEKRLRTDVLADIGERVSFEKAPLYGVVHESIYGGTVPGATAWSAQRVSEGLEGFHPDASPTESGPFYLTGEHIFPFQFEEDPALMPFRDVAEKLANKDDWAQLYSPDALADVPTVCAAAVYTDDIYVPRELSLETAESIRDVRVWETSDLQHDGIRRAGEEVFARLYASVRERG